MKRVAVLYMLMVMLGVTGGCSGTRVVRMDPGVESNEPEFLSKDGVRVRGYVGLDGVSHDFDGRARIEGGQLHFEHEGPPRAAEGPLEIQSDFYVDRNEVESVLVHKLHVGRSIVVGTGVAILSAALLAAAFISF